MLPNQYAKRKHAAFADYVKARPSMQIERPLRTLFSGFSELELTLSDQFEAHEA